MKFCKAKHSIQRKNSNHCLITECPMDTDTLNMALAEINGRYPETGYAVNRKVSEMVYIQSGNGTITVNHKTTNFKEGDVVLIEPNELFFWDGDFSAVIACSPAFTIEQHELIENEMNEAL